MSYLDPNISFTPAAGSPWRQLPDEPALTVTRYTSTRPARLSKRFERGADGSLTKRAGGNMSAGTAERLTFNTLAEFAALLPTLTPQQALGYGVSTHAMTNVVTAGSAVLAQSGPIPFIARTPDYLDWPTGPGLMMIDHDPAEGTRLDCAQLRAALAAICPALGRAPIVWRPSASSCIYSADGQELRGIGGQRLYIAVQDATDIPRAGKVLFDRLWLNEAGYYELSKSGAFLVRSLVDPSVWQSNRLDFAGGADCGPGLVQRLPAPWLFNANAVYLDTRQHLPDLTPDERVQLDALRAQMKEPLREKAATIQEAWIQERVAAGLAKLPEIERAGARAHFEQVYRQAAEGGDLHGDFVLTVKVERKAVTVTIADVLANPEQYHGAETLDPLEPDYNGGAWVGWLNLRADQPYLNSQAHGGQRFRLVAEFPSFTNSEIREPGCDDEPADLADEKDLYAPSAGLGEKSDYEADLSRLRNGSTVNARQTARAILTRYSWQSPRKRSFADLADSVISHLPNDSNPALPGSLRRFCAWLENQARARARASTTLDPVQLRAKDILYEVRTQINAALVAEIAAHTEYLWLVKAPHGTGKTEGILKPLSTLPGCCLAITNRVSLVADLCARLNLDNYQTVKERDMPGIHELGICLPSLINPKFRELLGRANIVLVDEISATLRELHTVGVGGTMQKAGPEAARILGNLFNQARLAVGVDADLSTLDCLALAEMTRRPIRVVEIKPESCGLMVEFDGADAMKATALAAIGAGEKVRIVSDSSRTVIELEALIRAQYPEKRVMAIQSRPGDSTAGAPATLALLKDVNAGIIEYDVLIHSPTVESGVSLTIPHFTRTFGFFCGRTVSPSSFIQMLRRDRNARLFEIGLAGHGKAWEETRPGFILNNLEATHRRTVELAAGAGGFTMHIEPATPFDGRVVKYTGQTAIDKNDAHQHLLLLLESRGFTVTRRDAGNPLSKAERQQARELADEHYQIAVMDAIPVTAEQRDALDLAYQPTPAESAQIERYDAALANGVDAAELDTDALRTYEHGKLNGWNRRYDAMQSTVLNALDADQADADIAQTQTLRRHGAAQVSAIHALFSAVGIDRATSTGIVTGDSIAETFKRLTGSVHRPVLENAGIARFDRKPKYPIRWLGDVLGKFGLALEEVGNSDAHRSYQIRQSPLLSKDGLTMKAPGWRLMMEIQERRHMRQKEKDIYAPSAGTDDLPETPPTMWT